MRELEPTEVWSYFEEILEIPRLSRNEEKIIQYLEGFAAEKKLKCKKDKTGNLLISKPASKGYENREIMILQSHVDMVGEKLKDVVHDFSKDPVKAKIQDEWVTAEGTTLGADDGIGIAASLAILASDIIDHGPIECLFTVDEETGMTGASGLKKDFMKGKILLNLDSEDEGEIFIGCAGGMDTIGRFVKKTKQVSKEQNALKITMEGLQGGHSGDEIHKGFGNAIKLMNRMLWNMDQRFKIHIASFEGGKLRNAIPREASAVIVFRDEIEEQVKKFFNSFYKELSGEIGDVEPGFQMSIQPVKLPLVRFKRGFQRRLLNMLYGCPHGVIGWSGDIEGLVETSTNLALIKDSDPHFVEVLTSHRSSKESAKRDIADRMTALFTLASAEVSHSGGYPGWEPDPSSEILTISQKVYKALFRHEPEIKAIHAGLECGLFLEKYPQLDMISIGPTIKGAHTPEERIDIASVGRFWDFLLALLQNAPVKR
ncbi:MAG: aminoacyl-histidine dipeptidase [Bacteroidales bacterium]